MIIIIIFMGTCLISLQSISAANVTVHPGESIQTAVNGASDGDNIIVYDDNNKAYTYKESISINKKVNIKSNGNVTIEAKNSSSAVFIVNSAASGSSIQNFIMTKSNYCIMINNANSCIISNNIISGASLVGIQFYGDIYNSRVTGNTITGVNPSVGNGISFEYGTVVNNTISGNNISNFLNGIIFNNNSENNTVSNNKVICTGYNGVGIYTTDNARGMTITGNTVTGAEDGIGVQQMGTNTANNFNISGNTVTGNKNGFWILLTDSTISNNTASGNLVSGIDITGKNNKILNNTASNNGNTGITIADYSNADYNTVSGNTLNNNTAGINSASNYTTISNNVVNSNSDNGIISTADHVTISGNNVTNTNGSGVLLVGVYNTVSSNSLQNNLIGLYIQKSTSADYNLVSNNVISYNNNGINSASPYTNFTNNTITHNNQTGLTVTGSNCNITGNSMSYNGEAGLTITSTSNNVLSNRLEYNLYGASFSNYNAANFNLNSVVGNTYQVYSPDTTGYLNALNNWWGSNSSPANIYGYFNVNPWIVLTLSANPNQLLTGSNSTVTADLNHNSNGVDVRSLYSGMTVPDGIAVNFSNDTLGTVTPLSGTTVNGTASAVFNAVSPGISKVNASVNSQNVSTNISISVPAAISTSVKVNPITGYKGVGTNLIATLRDTKNNITLAGKIIRFSVNGTFLGTAVTNSDGVATFAYTVTQNIGVYSILAEFIQDSTYAGSNGTANLTVATNIADVQVTNTVSNTKPHYNDTITYTVTVTNNGPCPALNVAITEWLNNGYITYVSDDSQGALNLSNGIWTIGTLASGQSAVLHIVAIANTPNTSTINTATYNPVTSDPNSTNNNQTATITVPAINADIQVNNSVSNTNPNYNDVITFTVTVTNNGPDAAQNVAISEWLNNGNITYLSDDSQGALNLSNGVWTIGTLASGQSATLHIVARASTPNTTIVNTATYNPVTLDPNSANNNQTVTITVPAITADIQVNNSVSNTNPNYNDVITFTVTVTNNGPDTVQNLAVSEWLSNGNITYISDDSQGALNLSNGVWTIGTLASGQSATLHIVAKTTTRNTTIMNTVTYNPLINDTNSSNNSQSVNITVT